MTGVGVKEKLPLFWCRTRDAAERERERKHLRDMVWLEKLLIAAGYRLRPKEPPCS